MVRKNNTSVIEEIFNAIISGVGVALGIAGLVLLLCLANKDGNTTRAVAFSIFGTAVIFTYLSSTLYHSLYFTRAQKLFKILDHSSIFLLIAGTYTPFTLITFREHGGMILFCLIWFLAISGIILKAFYVHKFKKLSVTLYLFMGWLVIFQAPSLKILPLGAITLLVSGGLAYTFGVIFYLFKKLPFHHMIWHIFVLCGSILHFFALFYL